MPTTVAVASGKGGVGKSTVALNLACAIAGHGFKVGLLDADIYAPDIPRMVNLARTEHRHGWTLARNPAAGRQSLEPIDEFGIRIMSTGFMIAEDQTLDWSSPLVQLLIRQFATDIDWGPLDYLIVDLPPGTADLQQEIRRQLQPTGVLIVVTPQDLAHLDAKKVVEMFRRAGTTVLGGVENMSNPRCPDCGAHIDLFPEVREDRSIWAIGVDRLGSIPMAPDVARAADAGKPLVVSHPDSDPARAFSAIADVILKRLLA